MGRGIPKYENFQRRHDRNQSERNARVFTLILFDFLLLLFAKNMYFIARSTSTYYVFSTNSPYEIVMVGSGKSITYKLEKPVKDMIKMIYRANRLFIVTTNVIYEYDPHKNMNLVEDIARCSEGSYFVDAIISHDKLKLAVSIRSSMPTKPFCWGKKVDTIDINTHDQLIFYDDTKGKVVRASDFIPSDYQLLWSDGLFTNDKKTIAVKFYWDDYRELFLVQTDNNVKILNRYLFCFQIYDLKSRGENILGWIPQEFGEFIALNSKKEFVIYKISDARKS